MTMIETNAPYEVASAIIERVVMDGDLAPLSPQQRVDYYQTTCKSLGLNPLTKPFAYIILNGKMTLYPTRNCTDQLRKINGISLTVLSQVMSARGIYVVTVRATDRHGRTDEDCGAVAISEKMPPEIRSNMEMKAVTKAKRRVTLSICGLGWPDESEVEDIPGVEFVDGETGEMTEKPTEKPAEKPREIESDKVIVARDKLSAAAGKGMDSLADTWKTIEPSIQKILQRAKDDIFKPMADEADLNKKKAADAKPV